MLGIIQYAHHHNALAKMKRKSSMGTYILEQIRSRHKIFQFCDIKLTIPTQNKNFIVTVEHLYLLTKVSFILIWHL